LDDYLYGSTSEPMIERRDRLNAIEGRHSVQLRLYLLDKTNPKQSAVGYLGGAG
jgi:hypothetical protein